MRSGSERWGKKVLQVQCLKCFCQNQPRAPRTKEQALFPWKNIRDGLHRTAPAFLPADAEPSDWRVEEMVVNHGRAIGHPHTLISIPGKCPLGV